MAHYLQQETGAFQPIGASDLSTAIQIFSSSLSTNSNSTSTSVYVIGAQVTQGSSGTWLVYGQVTVQDTAAGRGFSVLLSDGITTIASGSGATGGAAFDCTVSLMGISVLPASNLQIGAHPNSAVTTFFLVNPNSDGKNVCTNIRAIRIG